MNEAMEYEVIWNGKGALPWQSESPYWRSKGTALSDGADYEGHEIIRRPHKPLALSQATINSIKLDRDTHSIPALAKKYGASYDQVRYALARSDGRR